MERSSGLFSVNWKALRSRAAERYELIKRRERKEKKNNVCCVKNWMQSVKCGCRETSGNPCVWAMQMVVGMWEKDALMIWLGFGGSQIPEWGAWILFLQLWGSFVFLWICEWICVSIRVYVWDCESVYMSVGCMCGFVSGWVCVCISVWVFLLL